MRTEPAKTNKFHSRDVTPKGDSSPVSENDRDTSRRDRIVERTRKFQSIGDRLANDKFCEINWRYPGGLEAFPDSADLRVVDRYYPYAEGGPLAVDTPKTEEQTKFSMRKVEALKKANVRFIVANPEKSVEDLVMELERIKM